MGRPPLSAEQNREVKKQLISTVQGMISESGTRSATIRNVASRIKMNSSTIYKYFKDQDELILYACVDYLKGYVNELSAEQRNLDPEDHRALYLVSWRIFCRFAFADPDEFYFLFFGRHSSALPRIIEEYYQLYPEQLEGLPDSIQKMLLVSDLKARNMQVLRPVLPGTAEEELSLINEITVSCFRMLLSEMLEPGNERSVEEQSARMMTRVEYLISR